MKLETKKSLLACLILGQLACVEGALNPDVAFDNDAVGDRVGVGTLKRDGKADTTCGPFPSYYFEYMDDTRCRKRLPSNRDRDYQCQNEAESPRVFSPLLQREVEYLPAGLAPVVDERALVGLVPDDLRITLILVRRVDGVPHYRYLSNGRHEEIFQPWSSTKFIAIAQAGSTLRQVSEGRVGLTGSVDGVPIGDLASIVHSYEESRFTSNGLSRWFLNVGGRSAVSSSLYDWLQRPRTESLGGNYGHPTPELGYRVEDEDQWIEVEAVDRNGPKNALSTRTLAEGLKRLVMHREDPSTAMPYLQWDDVATLLYGAELSSMYSDGTPQGMEADTTVYLQQAIDVDAMEERSRGMWRIFGKLGFGYSRGGEYVHTGYACLPSIDEDGTPKLDHGKEFFVAVQLGADQKYHQTDDRIAGIYRTLTAGILDGTIK